MLISVDQRFLHCPGSRHVARCCIHSTSGLPGMGASSRGALIVRESCHRCVSTCPSANVKLPLRLCRTAGLSRSTHDRRFFSANGHCSANDPSLIVSIFSSTNVSACAGEGFVISPSFRYVVAAGLFTGDPMKQFRETVRTRGWVTLATVTGSAEGQCQSLGSGR